MNEKRKSEIINSVKTASENWHQVIATALPKCSMKTLAESVAFNGSLHLIFTDTANRPYTYIGPDNICNHLVEQFQGTITHDRDLFCWNGTCSLKNMINELRQFNDCQILTFQIPQEDTPEIIEALQPYLTLDIPLSDSNKSSNAYVGSRKICTYIKGKFSGHIFPCGNQWCWIGSTDINRIKNIVQLYQKKRL